MVSQCAKAESNRVSWRENDQNRCFNSVVVFGVVLLCCSEMLLSVGGVTTAVVNLVEPNRIAR